MPAYRFCLRTPDHRPHPVARQELPDLRAALIAAHRFARAWTGGGRALRGSLDIEDEGNEPVARILLVDLARQCS